MNIVPLCTHADLENYTKDNIDRHHFNAVVSDQDLMEVNHTQHQ